MEYTTETVWTVLQGNHPDGTDYKVLGDREATDKLNEESVSVLHPVPSAELLAIAMARGLFEKLDAAIASGTPGLVSLATGARTMLSRDGTELDLSLPDRQAMLGTLVTAVVFAQGDSDAIYAAAKSTISHAAQLGWPRVPLKVVADTRQRGAVTLRTGGEQVPLDHAQEWHYFRKTPSGFEVIDATGLSVDTVATIEEAQSQATTLDKNRAISLATATMERLDLAGYQVQRVAAVVTVTTQPSKVLFRSITEAGNQPEQLLDSIAALDAIVATLDLDHDTYQAYDVPQPQEAGDIKLIKANTPNEPWDFADGGL